MYGMPRFHTDYPYEWDIAEMQEKQTKALAEKYLDENRIHSETKWEFRAFFIEANIDELVNAGAKRALRIVNEAWEEHCYEYAAEVVAEGEAALRREWGV